MQPILSPILPRSRPPDTSDPGPTFTAALSAADQRYLDSLHRHLEASAVVLREELFTQFKVTVNAAHVVYEGPRAVTRVGAYRFTVDLDPEREALAYLRVEVLCPRCSQRGWSLAIVGYEGLAEAVRRPSLSQHFCDAGRVW